MKLKNLEIKKYQLFSIAFFGIFLIGLIFPWFNALNISVVKGLIIISKFFPFGLIAVIAFVTLNLVTIIFKNNVCIHMANLYPPIALSLLAIKLIKSYDEFTLSYGFYISMIALALSFAFCVANIICFKRTCNASIFASRK